MLNQINKFIPQFAKVNTYKLWLKYQGFFHLFYDDRLKAISRVMTYITKKGCGLKEGDWLEFGLYNGGTFIPTCLFRKYQKMGDMRVMGFDCFEGIPSKNTSEEKYFEPNSCRCSYEEFNKILKQYGIKDAILVKGLYENVLTDELRKELKLKKIKAVFMDCDLYSATKIVLDWITPCLQDGTIIMYDDWYTCQNRDDVGEQGATKKWLEENPNIRLTPYYPVSYRGMSFILNFNRKKNEEGTEQES